MCFIEELVGGGKEVGELFFYNVGCFVFDLVKKSVVYVDDVVFGFD